MTYEGAPEIEALIEERHYVGGTLEALDTGQQHTTQSHTIATCARRCPSRSHPAGKTLPKVEANLAEAAAAKDAES